VVGRSIVFVALAGLAVGLHAAGPRFLARLAYDRSSILRGEVWRLLTTYLVHAGLGHLLWNLVATGVVWVSVARAFGAGMWLAATLLVALGSSLAVLLLQPEVRAMAGLSALLHGLLAAGATAEIRRGERLAGVLLALLGAKIVWEQLAGPPALGGPIPSDRVAIGAHAFGALAGLLAGLALPAAASSASAGGARPSPSPVPPAG
jgi:rhomboid family GlyGly-CTERM serine protease